MDFNELLSLVDKPARYCGGEVNTPEIKQNARLKYLMCFPDVYEVAHSNLGIKILYYLLNSLPDVSCETCFSPWTDMEKLLRENGLPLFSQETRTPVSEFDIVGFSLQYELSYTNVLQILDLGGIPLLRAQRKDFTLGEGAIVMAGGPCTVNPAPVARFFDLIAVGDGEQSLLQTAQLYLECKAEGKKKSEFLARAAQIEGIYVPSLGGRVKRAVVKNLDGAFFPAAVQIPNIEAVHNRAVLEIFRGCTRGCRFCQAGMIYRPVRYRSEDRVAELFSDIIDKTGFDEISLSSLSTCDYPNLGRLLKRIKPLSDARHVNISLPSTRVDSFEAEYVANSRLSSLTFAPEAGTQALRDVINKNVTEEDIFTSLEYAFKAGYSAVKLYFMLGLPTETMRDVEGIAELCKKIRAFYKKHCTARKPLRLSVSTSVFVPKPFTPFQWEAQSTLDETEQKQEYLKAELKKLGVKYNWHDRYTSLVEAALARGGEGAGEAVEAAYRSGCKFDGWTEYFSFAAWVQAFETCGLSVHDGARAIDIKAALPWDNIEVGVSKSFLLSERDKAYRGQTTDDCRKGCRGCGIKDCPSYGG